MKNRKIYLLVLMLLVCILSISAISATENTTNKDVISADNNKETNLETNIQYDDVSNSKENVELNLEENKNNDKEGQSQTDETTTEPNAELSFTDLNTTINGNTNSTIYLSNNYKYNYPSDYNFKDGIPISRNLNVYGNGITINGNNMARMFNVTDSNLNVNFYNINFINGYSMFYAGAIWGGNAHNCNFTGNRAGDSVLYKGNAYNCTFTSNTVEMAAIRYGNAYNCTFISNTANSGGAMANANAYNCIFINNRVTNYGGAIYEGNATNCTFTNNTAKEGGAMYGGNAYNCTFTNNSANSGGAINYVNAYNCTFTNNNATNGGAAYLKNTYNCTFINNRAKTNGGALYKTYAFNCTFRGNNATNGGAMYLGTSLFCTFNGDTIYNTTIIPAVINVLNYTSPYGSGEKLKFNLTANGTLYNGFNTTIKIYKDGSVVKTVYGLTGEGWIVDLDGGKYMAELSLTDYPEEKPSNASITVKADLTFTELNTIINDNTNSTIYLSDDFKFDSALDINFKEGISISRDLTIYGNGATIDGNNIARIFNVTDPNLNVKFYNINFINGNATSGGAIYGGNAYNCTFTNNKAELGGALYNGGAYNCTFTQNNATNGGAVYNVDAFNCTFKNNSATTGQAMYEGNSILCRFNGDSTHETNIIPAIINVLNYTSTYGSGEKLKFNLTANGTLYDGFNTTIDIYQNGTLLKTVYAITGEGWTVDLDYGTYTAVLKLTDYPDEPSSNVTITIKDSLTFTDLNSIINDNTNSTIYLSINYKYDSTLDENFKRGIPISRNLTIYGNGVTLDGNYIARIFNVTDSDFNVTFYNINFINGNATSGGAIYRGTAYYCNFTGNHAHCYDSASGEGGAIHLGKAYYCNFNENYVTTESYYTSGGAIGIGEAYYCNFTGNYAPTGGAIGKGDAYNCTFINNSARQGGGAIYKSQIYNCTFIGNNATYGGAMSEGYAHNCTFINNSAKERGGALDNVNVYTSTFIGNNALEGGAIKNFNKNIYKCNFTGNSATKGGAIYGSNAYAYNCTFTNNNATKGGATYDIYVFNSTFHGNNATQEGGAMYNGTSLFCTFNGDTTSATTIIPAIINVSNYSSTYGSGKKLEFNLTANGKAYYRFNTTIDIYQNGTLLKTVYALTGEGWTVDLDYGTYTAVLSLTDYPEEKPSNATISIKEEPSIVITPITNATVGEEITINYTTNSTGAVTIKVNGQAITGNKFTPEKPGTYNITVEIAETEQYVGASSETSFTILKTNTTVEIGPITNVTLGQEIKINITTNSNGTVTIKVNGQAINGTKFTPTIPGTYNLTVEIAENEYYKGATNETTFTIPKTNTTIIIKPISDVPIGEEMKIKYTTNSNGTVTIKVNNQTITGNKFTPQTVGIYNLTVEIAANDYYTGATYETTFKAIEEIATKITAKPVTTTYYMSKILTITLKDANGKPISGAILTVKLDGTKKYKTNKNGQVKIQVGALTPKTYNVKITYAGSKKYKKSTTTVKIPIKKATPKITANAVKYNGKNKQFKVYFLTDHMKYHALKNKEVTLKVNGKTYKVKTNSKGQGVFNINTLKKGKYTAVLTVPANSCYNKVTRNVVINVKK